MPAKRMKRASVPFEKVLDRHLRNSSRRDIVAYLNACLGDGTDQDLEAFFAGLHDLARAQGVTKLAQEARVSRDTLYKMLEYNNPTLETLQSVLRGLDLGLILIDRKRA